jgi:hypothetical protein
MPFAHEKTITIAAAYFLIEIVTARRFLAHDDSS